MDKIKELNAYESLKLAKNSNNTYLIHTIEEDIEYGKTVDEKNIIRDLRTNLRNNNTNDKDNELFKEQYQKMKQRIEDLENEIMELKKNIKN